MKPARYSLWRAGIYVGVCPIRRERAGPRTSSSRSIARSAMICATASSQSCLRARSRCDVRGSRRPGVIRWFIYVAGQR